MNDSLYIAWKYICSKKVRTATLVACVTLILFLPVSLELLLMESETQLMSRAESTPLLLGAKGSALDLAMNALYFGEDVPELITMEASRQIEDTGLAMPVPMHVRFGARGYPVVGTTLDYFDFRGLKVADGRGLAVLGDCVIGGTVAERLDLKAGDSLVSSPETLFDLAGVYPLKMNVAGILHKSYTSDDLAVFVDLKTAWVIEGFVHGHEDLAKAKDPQVILKKEDKNIVGSPKLFQYMEITEDNLDLFHLHGDIETMPITAVLIVPHDTKSGTVLRGRYLSGDQAYQIAKPKDVIDGLLQNIFRIKNVLDAVILVVSVGMILAIILVFALSLRLRQREIETIFKLGCGRMTIARLLGAEIAVIGAMGLVICATLLILLNRFSGDLVRTLFIR
ncbi:MAG: ABC transporter permease [Planctomycetota bacterium]|jgi:putative ABC transport system permease protein